MKRKSILNLIYYKFYQEKRQKSVINYLLLSIDEINKLSEKLNLFSMVCLSERGFYVAEDGLFYIHFDVGALKTEYCSMPSNRLKNEIILRFKKFFLEAKDFYIPVGIQSLTDQSLVIFYPISDFGKQNFDRLEKLKQTTIRNMNHEKSIQQKRLNDVFSKAK